MLEMYLFALVNLIFCAGICFICLCRNNVMNRRVLFRVRTEYAVYLGAALASGSSFLWNEWPAWGQCGVSAALFYGLWSSGVGWKDGPPESATGPAPLGDD